MAVSFFKYLNEQRVQSRIETAADLIINTGFPIERFCDWYCDVGVNLTEAAGQVVLEDFWRDTLKGAAGGALAGGAAGGVPGAFVGGATGAFLGGAKHAGRGIHRLFNPNGYKISAFMRDRSEVINLLQRMKMLSDDIRNDTNFAKGGGKSLHNPAFDTLLNKTIAFLSLMEKPQLVGATPSPSPSPSPTPSPTPTPRSGPKDETEVANSAEFKAALGEIVTFANGFGSKLDTAFEGHMAKAIWAGLSSGPVNWPDIVDQFKNEVMFADTDAGYQDLFNKLKTDPNYTANIADPDKVAKRFLFRSRVINFGKGMSPMALAADAKKEIDAALATTP